MDKDDTKEPPVTSSAMELHVGGQQMRKNDFIVDNNFSNSRIENVQLTNDNSVIHHHYHSSTEKRSISSGNDKMSSLQEWSTNPLRFVFDMMCCRIASWRQFANTLGIDYIIRDLVHDERYSDIHGKINKCIHEKRETSIDIDPDWLYWRHVLLQIGEKDLVDDIEDTYPYLVKDSQFHLSNTEHKAFEDFGVVAHDATEGELFEKLPNKLKEKIKICVGAGKIKTYAVKKIKDITTIQDAYFEKYKILKTIKIYNFSTIGKREECMILQTMHAWLKKNNDNGFCVKGYDVKQHAQYFCEGYSNKTPIKDSYILTYSAKYHVIFYIDTEPTGIKKSMRENRLNIRHLCTTNQCLHGNPFVYIPITLCDPNSLEHLNKTICKTCVDLQLVASAETFKNLELFEKWWQEISTDVKDITDELKGKIDLSGPFFKSVIGFMAVAPFDLPNFTNSPDKEIAEAQKLILLTPEQQDIIYSNDTRKIIKGSFGSGKTIAAQQLIKLVVYNLSDLEFVYYIFHETSSAYVLEMIKLVNTFKTKNVIACKISDLVDSDKSLSSVFQHLLQKHEGRTVHVFIEEFDGEILDKEEVDKIVLVLKNNTFANSHIVLVSQSMESDRFEIQDKDRLHYDKYQFEKLSELAHFKFFDLSYLLRSSLHITNIIDVAIPILKKALIQSVLPKPDIKSLNRTTPGLKGDLNITLLSTHNSANFSQPLEQENSLPLKGKLNSEKPNDSKAASAQFAINIDKLLKYFTINEHQYELKTKLESSYKYIGKRDTGHTVKGSKPVVYYPFKREIQNYSYQICCISKVLKTIELKNQTKDTIAIICMNDDSKSMIQTALKVNKSKWTDDPQLLLAEEFDFLLADYASVRGCEFLNVILVYSTDEEHLKHDLINCLSRCKLNLVILVLNKGTPDKILVEILAEWEKDLVVIEELNCLKNITQEEMAVFNDNHKHLLNVNIEKQIVDIKSVVAIQKLFSTNLIGCKFGCET